VSIRVARDSDRIPLARMRALLWPTASFDEHLKEIGQGTSYTFPLVTFVADDADGELIGFIEVDLRSHADGCDPRQPVGFVEGWFVHESWRGRGVGGELMRAAEEWARSQGCVEMASDTWIDSEGSQRAHAALGFEVVDRCVHFRKSL
jgi:aminoglycoside 6'-N-acetyltransferase I